MSFTKSLLSGLVAGALLAGSGAAQATNYGESDAEAIRKLDIMLMVTSLRCRTGSGNFQADYGRFTSRHVATLNAASNELRGKMERQYGKRGAKRALDKMSVSMANRYGRGHPWLSCDELKLVANDLSAARGRGPLLAAANELLGNTKPTPLVLAGGR